MNAIALLAVAAVTTVVVGAKTVDDVTIYASKEATETCKVQTCALLTPEALQAVYKAGVEEGRRQFLTRMDTEMCLKGVS